MRDPYQLLREKESDIARVRQEIEALRAIIPLLEDDDEIDDTTSKSYATLRPVHRE
jgi:hypothetical protein